VRRLLPLIDAPLTVTVADVELTIPHCGCDLWLPAVGCNRAWHRVLLDLLDEPSQQSLQDILADGGTSIQEVDKVTKTVIEEGSGRDWWTVPRIIDAADALWDAIGGRLVMAGVLPNRVTIAAWLDAAWFQIQVNIATGKHGKEDLQSLIAEIMAPPPEELELPDGEEASMDEAAFMAAAAAMPGRVDG